MGRYIGSELRIAIVITRSAGYTTSFMPTNEPAFRGFNVFRSFVPRLHPHVFLRPEMSKYSQIPHGDSHREGDPNTAANMVINPC